MRLITDIFAYCSEHVPKWNTISISGYHIREAGCTAVQEVAFTLADGIAYVEAAVKAGLDVDDFAHDYPFSLMLKWITRRSGQVPRCSSALGSNYERKIRS